MARNPRYDPLFEPVKIGPVTAPNRFYQVPHCSGMGYLRPQMLAAMRGIKAEGGWGVVCTEYCSIDAGADESPYPHASLRDDDDVKNLRLMTEAVHRHGSLAGVELWYGGHSSANMESREIPLDVASLPNASSLGMPMQSQAMSIADIEHFRGLYRAAARRALAAEFDIVYVYATHGYLINNFLSQELNQREDKYGGSLENRVRLLRQVIEDVGEIVAGRSALAVRYSIPRDYSQDSDQLLEGFRLVSELPDLWDITVNDYHLEMGSSRFVREASNQAAVAKIKSLTSKPVVSVGRFTSPDTMLAQINSGVQDFIGAARPSIADPFLPGKINQGREEDIRECIGCNVCYAHDSLGVPIRCTQNPTMGEEWRRDWHPDRIQRRHADESVLVVGAGPAGLEAACALGQRGYRVVLAEAGRELGGRVSRESRLPGLAEWARVRDWRLGQLAKMTNVEIYPDNRLDADAVLELDCHHLLLATGSHWRVDGVGQWRQSAFEGWQTDRVISVDAILDGYIPRGPVVLYDDDHYYLGSAIALKLRAENIAVTLVTPRTTPADWGRFTDEHGQTMAAMISAGIEIISAHGLVALGEAEVELECVYSGRRSRQSCENLIPLSARIADDSLWNDLQHRAAGFEAGGGTSMQRIGDCLAPGIIAAAVYSGHKAARELGETPALVKRDRPVVN